MKRALFAFGLVFFGCAGSRPPPQSCDMPPKEEKKVEIATCPVDELPTDAGPDTSGDAP